MLPLCCALPLTIVSLLACLFDEDLAELTAYEDLSCVFTLPDPNLSTLVSVCVVVSHS